MDSADAYDSNASEFLRARDKSRIGSIVVDRWARNFRNGARVLELGCGGGYPITRVLRSAGLRLWAVDSSATLLAEFRLRFPDVPVQCAKVQESTFFEQTYDGAIAIGLIFLLPESEQSEVIFNIARVLQPGGRFLFTAPIEKGNWVDTNTGIMCNSPGQAVYENYFRAAGLRTVATFTDAGDNNHYDLERIT